MAAPQREEDLQKGPQANLRPARRPEWLAFALSVLWLALVVAVAWLLARRGISPAEALVFVLVVLAVFLPVIMVWQTVLMLGAVRQMREEALRLRAMAGLMRGTALQPKGPPASPTRVPGTERPGTDLPGADLPGADLPGPPAHGPGDTTAPPAAAAPEPGLAFASRRAAATGAEAGPAPLLSLENPAPTAVSVALDDLIRALHFPESEDDAEGFAALRRALRDHATAELIRAAQTVLSGLAEDGIYLDRIAIDRARPDLWRAFAQGARSPAVAALGGIRDRSCLALTVARMRADPAFRDAAHRFLRAFDQRLAAIEPQADDTRLARLAETRSARAFMLLGRITGVFG